jgi:hypothetical protein
MRRTNKSSKKERQGMQRNSYRSLKSSLVCQIADRIHLPGSLGRTTTFTAD